MKGGVSVPFKKSFVWHSLQHSKHSVLSLNEEAGVLMSINSYCMTSVQRFLVRLQDRIATN